MRIDFDRMLRRLLGANIELVVFLAPDLAAIKADPIQIEQVLMNLAVNAKDAMIDGGKLIIETSNVTLNAERGDYGPGTPSGEYVMLSVTDSGVGMTEEVKSRIFELFFTIKSVGKGTGLGLATCYGFVKRCGGHIEVEDGHGEASVFRVYLPKVEDAVPAFQAEPVTEPSICGSETLFLAEDEPMILAMVSPTLRKLGYTVFETANGEEALRVAAELADEDLHVLVTDIVMPRMGGL